MQATCILYKKNSLRPNTVGINGLDILSSSGLFKKNINLLLQTKKINMKTISIDA